MKQQHEDDERTVVVYFSGKTTPPKHEKRFHHQSVLTDGLSSPNFAAPEIAAGEIASRQTRTSKKKERIEHCDWTGRVGMSSLVFNFSESILSSTFNGSVFFTGNELISSCWDYEAIHDNPLDGCSHHVGEAMVLMKIKGRLSDEPSSNLRQGGVPAKLPALKRKHQLLPPTCMCITHNSS